MSTDRPGPILVIDDDDDIRETILETLKDEGYDAVGAGNGQEAFHRLTTGGLRPSVILLDIMMPVMDGRTFRSKQLASPELASIPVVVITADARASTKGIELRSTDALMKPMQLESLLRVAERYAGPPAAPTS